MELANEMERSKKFYSLLWTILFLLLNDLWHIISFFNIVYFFTFQGREEIEELKRTIRDLRSELHAASLRLQTNVENTTRADVRMASLTREVEEERARVQRLRDTHAESQTTVAAL
jgi:hypothetical protein